MRQLEEKPVYFSDNESHFEIRSVRLGRGRARTLASSSVPEPHEDERVNHFTRKLRTELWRLIQKEAIADVYIFTPKEHEIVSQLQTKLQCNVKMVVKDDFIHEHPFRLL